LQLCFLLCGCSKSGLLLQQSCHFTFSWVRNAPKPKISCPDPARVSSSAPSSKRRRIPSIDVFFSPHLNLARLFSLSLPSSPLHPSRLHTLSLARFAIYCYSTPCPHSHSFIARRVINQLFLCHSTCSEEGFLFLSILKPPALKHT
jgi:hypothetical protein